MVPPQVPGPRGCTEQGRVGGCPGPLCFYGIFSSPWHPGSFPLLHMRHAESVGEAQALGHAEMVLS